MTWGEFKKALADHGVQDTDEINYFDFSGWHDLDRLEIARVPRKALDAANQVVQSGFEVTAWA